MSSATKIIAGPLGQPPITSGIVGGGQTVQYNSGNYGGAAGWTSLPLGNTGSTSFVDFVNYTGSGIITGLAFFSVNNTGYMDLLIDGITTYSSNVYAGSMNYKIVIGSAYRNYSSYGGGNWVTSLIPGPGIPFKSSIQIRAKVDTGGACTVYYKLWKMS
jgi:hypothetical protein